MHPGLGEGAPAHLLHLASVHRARRGREGPGGARRGQEGPGGARRGQEGPGGARRGQEGPGGARRGQEGLSQGGQGGAPGDTWLAGCQQILHFHSSLQRSKVCTLW